MAKPFISKSQSVFGCWHPDTRFPSLKKTQLLSSIGARAFRFLWVHQPEVVSICMRALSRVTSRSIYPAHLPL